MESLAGQFLISTLRMPDPRFREQVIYMCAHNEEGAMGLVINNPNPEMTLVDILRGTEMPIPEEPLPPVYIGGPVELDAGFILFSSDYTARNELEISPRISLSRDNGLLYDIARNRGPEHFLFMLGYAGWGPGQLEAELADNGWLIVPSDFDVLFNTPDELKWKMAARKHGIDISIYGDIIGNA